jgi:membrane protease YdiL (CAAX protease family)
MLQNSSPDTIPTKKLPLLKRVGISVALPVWVFVGFMAASLGLLVTVQGLVGAGVPLEQINPTIYGLIASAVVYLTTLLLVIGGPFLLKFKTSLKELGLHRLPMWKDIGIAFLGILSYFILSGILVSIAQNTLTFVDFDQKQDVGFEGLSARYEYVLAFIALVVIAPVAEEILFRGYLFGKLRKVAQLWISILITSVLFGFVHFAWNVGIDVFALSIIMCLARVWSGSLWPSMLMHMTKNFIAFYFLFINPTLLTTMGG